MSRRAALAAVVLLLAWLALAPRAEVHAQAGERIDSYAVDITVERDGTLRIVEDIDYDFGTTERHGIFRDIPLRSRYDDRNDRVLGLTVERIEADRGASSKYVVESAGEGITRIRIGDPDRTTTGVHRYRITYRIRDALNGFPDHDELYWNAIGAYWSVPIARAQVTVHLPSSDVPRVACHAGPSGSSLACQSSSAAPGEARFAQTALDSFEGLTVVVGFPTGIVPTPHPALVERWSLQRAFTLDPLRVGAALLLLVASVWLVIRAVWRGGRDVRWRGSPVEVVFGGTAGEQPVPLFEGGAYAIEYAPPDGVRPGQVGALLDERAQPRDIAASIVDLAARGHLRIDEIPAEGWFGKPDWRLTRSEPTGRDMPLREYEQRLLDELFNDGDSVLLSDLNTKFATRLARVEEALYADVVAAGWFEERPDRRRMKWLGISIAALVLSVGIEVFAIARTHFAVVPVPLVLASLLLLALHGRMPRRTAKGTAALRRALGFRDFIRTAETRRAEFAERANLFYEYLPYAVVFGCVDRWARTFEGLALQAPAWYGGSTAFNALAFGNAVDSFAHTSAASMAAAAPGSRGFSGGSVGGGGGGGGGGSW